MAFQKCAAKVSVLIVCMTAGSVSTARNLHRFATKPVLDY